MNVHSKLAFIIKNKGVALIRSSLELEEWERMLPTRMLGKNCSAAQY
jgi:hypothetical protein